MRTFIKPVDFISVGIWNLTPVSRNCFQLENVMINALKSLTMKEEIVSWSSAFYESIHLPQLEETRVKPSSHEIYPDFLTIFSLVGQDRGSSV
jgi:hypothetical protein